MCGGGGRAAWRREEQGVGGGKRLVSLPTTFILK